MKKEAQSYNEYKQDKYCKDILGEKNVNKYEGYLNYNMFFTWAYLFVWAICLFYVVKRQT